jgi:tRNA-dihydrouridine synthase B
MAGVTDLTFRTLCKEFGADVMLTEFVSAEGILHRDAYTRKYTEFTAAQRPVGVQLFGADGTRMAEAARKIIDWQQPDFIDLNFGCPVNKVVARNGGSSLLKDCPLLADVATKVVRAVAGQVPVTAKIRIGWDARTINAVTVARLLEEAGLQALAVHGRTRAQGYSGEADWAVIDACARAVAIPVIGNGDLQSAADVLRRRRETAVAAVMIGRAAMSRPWIFREIKAALATGTTPPPLPLEARWQFILRHCRLAVDSGRHGDERHTMVAMRARLVAYCKGFPGARELRQHLTRVSSLADLEQLAAP